MSKEKTIETLKELEKNELLSSKYKEKLQEAINFIENEKLPKVIIYTDGGCLINPCGPGGYGYVILKDEKIIREIGQGFKSTTNNRMELRGPLAAMESLKEPHEIEIYSDSKYFTDAINQKWIENWLKTNWKNGKVKNIDLWKQLLVQFEKHKVTVHWVKGHNDNKYNEECDRLATKAYKSPNLIDDIGFKI